MLWDLLTTFLAARRTFLSIFDLYEHRVRQAARERGVDRHHLKLSPRDLFSLFHLRRLETLRDYRLEPLWRMVPLIFGAEGDVGLLDAYCGHIYHEVSILSREHRSVGRFVRRSDPRRYRALFEEVTGYYPERLRRVRRFFALATRRLDELLPRWGRERVVVRSVWLFGDALARRAWGRGREAFYERLYPSGGAIRGLVEAARSLWESGFAAAAREPLDLALATAAECRARRTLRPDERQALEEAEALEQRMSAASSPKVPSAPA